MNSEEFIIKTVLKLPDLPDDGKDEGNNLIENADGMTDVLSDGVPVANIKQCFEQKILETKLKIAESAEFNVTGNDMNTFKNFDEMFQGTMPNLLLALQGKDPILNTVNTFDELKAVSEKTSNRTTYDVPQTIFSAPIDALGHYASFGEYMSNLYVDNELADTKIEVDGRYFMAHRAVLCCHSNYFEKILLRNKLKRIPVDIKLIGISSGAFETFLEFIYTGHLHLLPCYVLDMFIIAEVLGIKTLRHMLASVEDRLDLKQALQLLLQHGKIQSTQLYKNLLTRITNQFETASRLPGFLDMDVDLFCHFLQSDDLEIASEFDVFQLALRWIEHGAQDREGHAFRIMNLLRFPYMSRNEMFRCTTETNFIRENDDLRLLLIMSVWYITALKLQRSDPFDVKIPPPRRGYKAKYLSVVSSLTSCVASETKFDVNQSSLPNPNKPPLSHSPRHAKPVLLPADSHVVVKHAVVTKTRVKSPSRYAKPILVPQKDGGLLHDHAINTMIPKQPARFSKPVMWPSPPPQKEEPNATRPVPSKFAQPIIWPPPKPWDEERYKERLLLDTRPVTSALPVSAQLTFWNGKQPKQPSPQLSPARHAKPVLVPTPSPKQQSPIFAFPDACNEKHHVTSPWQLYDVKQENYSPDESAITPPTPQCDTEHVADLVSQFSSKLSSTTASTFCSHPSSPGRYAKPLMLPVEAETLSGNLCMSRSNELQTDQHATHDERKPTAIEIFIIGGFCDDLHSQKEKDGDCSNTQWMRYCNLPAPRKNFAVAMVARHIYLIGGCDPRRGAVGQPATNTLFRMDFDNKIWRKMAPMWECRESHCACAIGNMIYVLGGLDNFHRPLSSVECYNVYTDAWYNITIMPEPRFAAAATCLDGKCYIAGGLIRDGPDFRLKALDTMDCYDPQTNRWEIKCNLRMPVCHSSLVNVEGSMYLCGGAVVNYLDNNGEMLQSIASVDKYDSHLDTWKPMTEMMVPRHSAAVAVAGSRLFIIGGKNSTTERFLRSTECLDTRNLEWATRSVDLPFPARSISCVVCPVYGNN